MKKVLMVSLFALSLTVTSSFARGGGHSGSYHSSPSRSYSIGSSHSVRSYVKRNGTYVPRSHATNPNKSKYDNWSTRGNVNPYTGKRGTKDPISGK